MTGRSGAGIVKVLIVDDSPTAREFLHHLLDSEPGIRVIGAARDGREAIQYLKRQRPDVITMDIHMPGMDGIEATRTIMATQPVPIVIVSGNWEPGEVETTFRAMEAGALAVVRRPRGIEDPRHAAMLQELLQTVKLMSEIKVVKRWGRDRLAAEVGKAPSAGVSTAPADVAVVAIGASTGGPLVLQSILGRLPRCFPAPVLMVQHVAAGFLQGMIDWLAGTSGIPLQVAVQGETAIPGRGYFPPDGHNMGINANGRLQLVREPRQSLPGSSVGYLFRSVAEAFGERAVGVLLTGMGRDGAEELRLMRDKGALTIAQDKESSVVFGMPGAAVELQAARYVLPPHKIAALLETLATKLNTLPIGEGQ